MNLTPRNYSLDTDLTDLLYAPATEMTTSQLTDFMDGRKELFNAHYAQVVKGLRKNDRALCASIVAYRDKNIDILSSPYLLNYTKFNKEDSDPLYMATGVSEAAMDQTVEELKGYIRDNCIAIGIKPPDFANITGFRMLLLLAMRYYLERGEQEKLDLMCHYMAYSMFYTAYYNFFRNTVPRRETMVYTINNMSNKYKLKQQKNLDEMLSYPVKLCMETYKKRLLDCTDQDLMYIIAQIKSRIRDLIKNIKAAYVENDNAKNAIFTSKEILDGMGEDGSDSGFVERASTSGDIERLSQQYTTRFFQKPVDDQIVLMVSKMNEVSKNEITNALLSLKSDSNHIPEVKTFHDCLFYIYLNEEGTALADVHSKNFMASMDAIYKKGNSKDENILKIKQIIERWLQECSRSYREINRLATLNSFRKAIYQYFIFTIVLRE